MRARTARWLRMVAGASAASAACGAAFVAADDTTPAALATGLLVGGLTGALLCSLEIGLQGPGRARLRRVPVPLLFLLRTLIYGAVFVTVPGLVVPLVRVLAPGLPAGAGTMGPNLLLWFAVALAINSVFVLRALLGAGTLLALLTGRYHHPQREERVVLFLDLRDSTALAERLGDQDFHRFLNRVFFDLTDPVLESGGEIYRYVGDEIIVTWKLERSARKPDCLGCVLAMAERLSRRAGEYGRLFGAEPRFRAALHAGPVVVGEMGDVKREIVILGDTMNTASRIEEACRATGREAIASAAALAACAPPPPGTRVESLGTMALRGKEAGIELFALAKG